MSEFKLIDGYKRRSWGECEDLDINDKSPSEAIKEIQDTVKRINNWSEEVENLKTDYSTYYGSVDICISFDRLESQEEYDARVRKEIALSERKAKSQKEKDRAEFERLKKIFGGDE